jgi:hypothetical protein
MFPLPLGEFFHQLLELPIVLHRLPNPSFPALGYEQLAGFSLLTLGQVERQMGLAARAAAVGLATGILADGEGPPQQPVLGGQLSDAGAAAALWGREI